MQFIPSAAAVRGNSSSTCALSLSDPARAMEDDRMKDVEVKLGRKVPDPLLRSLRDGAAGSAELKLPDCARQESRDDLIRLEAKMCFLRQEMAHLRAIDVKLLRQLLALNEGLDSVRWSLEERSAPLSRDGSLSGSLYSLSESPGGSLRDGSDGLDDISVGSYLDTLADASSDDTDCFPLDGTDLQTDAEQYYCFG